MKIVLQKRNHFSQFSYTISPPSLCTSFGAVMGIVASTFCFFFLRSSLFLKRITIVRERFNEINGNKYEKIVGISLVALLASFYYILLLCVCVFFFLFRSQIKFYGIRWWCIVTSTYTTLDFKDKLNTGIDNFIKKKRKEKFKYKW